MFLLSAPVLKVPVMESNALRSSHTNVSIISELSTKSNVSAVSELSSKSETTALSNVRSKSTNISRTRRPSRSKHADKPRGSIKSDVSRSVSSSRSSRISRSHLNSKNTSSPSGATTHHFIKNSYLWNTELGWLNLVMIRKPQLHKTMMFSVVLYKSHFH